MALSLIILMGSGTCCEINAVVGIKYMPQDSMASTYPIHNHIHTNYLPLIPNTIWLRSITMMWIHNYPHLRYHLTPGLIHQHWHLRSIKWSPTSLNVNMCWSVMSTHQIILILLLFVVHWCFALWTEEHYQINNIHTKGR